MRSEFFSAVLFYGCVFSAPLPFGSGSALSVAFWCVILSASLALTPIKNLERSHVAVIAALGFIVSAFLLVALLQDSTTGFAGANEIWVQARSALGEPLLGSPNVVRGQSVLSLGPTFCCILAFSIGFLRGVSRRQARGLLDVIMWSGALYAAYGIVSMIADPASLLWRERQDYIGVVLGTFVNRNTAATYFGSCSAICFLAVSERWWDLLRTYPVSTTSGPTFFTLDRPFAKAAGRVIALLLCLTAMFLTNSRAGVLCTLAGLSIGAGAWFRNDLLHSEPQARRRLAAIIALLMLFLFAIGSVNHRFDTQGFSDEGRLDVYASVVRMIRDHPYLGVGLGSFANEFPSYRPVPPSIWGVWDMAHSTPLELAAEVGLPLALCVCLAMITAWLLLVRGFLIRRRDNAIPLTAAVVVFIGACHSCVDFSLQIPGYAIVFMAVFGTGLAQAFRTPVRVNPARIRTGEPALDAARVSSG